jgi:hypothetical protein
MSGLSSELGMLGEKIVYGEETELIELLRKKFTGVKIIYEPKLFVYHLIREKKMKLSWLSKNNFAHGRYVYLTFSVGEHKLITKHFLDCWGSP